MAAGLMPVGHGGIAFLNASHMRSSNKTHAGGWFQPILTNTRARLTILEEMK
jgi:hypothetical protein